MKTIKIKVGQTEESRTPKQGEIWRTVDGDLVLITDDDKVVFLDNGALSSCSIKDFALTFVADKFEIEE